MEEPNGLFANKIIVDEEALAAENADREMGIDDSLEDVGCK